MDERLQRCKIGPGDTLRAAMYALEVGACGIALVVNDHGVLVGVMTDGDIRRALLAGRTLDCPLTPYFQRQFTTASPLEGRGAVIELMHSRLIERIPIVDARGRLLGLHLLRELLGAVERQNWAVVMAGGRGTRLGSLTQHIPKPMISIAGRPILERIVLHLVGFGIRRIYLAVHYLADMVEEHFGDGERFGCDIQYLRETQPSGTAGALALLSETPTNPLLVMNGDLVTQADLGAMLDSHVAAGNEATVGVRQYTHEVPFGCVELDDDRITAIAEKPTLARLVSAGIYVLNPAIAGRVLPNQEVPMTGVLEEAIQEGKRVGAFGITGDWIDVGQPSQLKVAREGNPVAPLPTEEGNRPQFWRGATLEPVSKAA